jgi:outer membrane protein OmpA-like peptidoglycan-associated protein
MKAKSFFWLAPIIISFGSAFAQSQKVFDEDNITTSALVHALTPATESGAKAPTRGIQVKPSASLLITFQANSARLTSHARQSLEKVGEALNSEKLNNFHILIEGHADPRGDPASNLKLSQRRAESVRQYLVQNKHVEKQRLDAIGKGDTELLNTADPLAPENRRVTIINLMQ